MATRILSGVLLSPLLLVILVGGLPLYILSFILTVISIREFTNALKVKSINIYSNLGYIFASLFFLKNVFDISTVKIFCFNIVLIMCNILFILIKKNKIKDLVVNLAGTIYIILGFDAIIGIINNFQFGFIYVWLIFIVALLSDTMAYFVGSILGKHKLAPILSPKKTIEGSVGAIIFSTIGCLVLGKIFELNVMLMLIVGILGSIVSQIGDLLASFVKRYVGIKDYGNLIPGHGGILDRFDSVILVSQFIYLILFIVNII